MARNTQTECRYYPDSNQEQIGEFTVNIASTTTAPCGMKGASSYWTLKCVQICLTTSFLIFTQLIY